MATEGLRKHSTTLYNGVLSGQQTQWSGLLPNHTNLTNHQLVMTADAIVDEGTGQYEVFIIPDTEGVTQAVYTGLVLDLGGKDSAIINFTGVIRGLYIRASAPILQPGVHVSAVLSSFSRYRKTYASEQETDHRDYVSSEFRLLSSGATNYAVSAPNHTNMVYHQLSLMANESIDDVYALRIIPESDVPLETTVDTGHELNFDSTGSAMLYFGGVITGLHLTKVSGSSSGVPVRVVLSSSVERYDEVVYEYIGASPISDEHITDYNNPHQTSWNNLLNKPQAFLNYDHLGAGQELVIGDTQQLLIWESYSVEGSLTVEPGGELIVLHDRPEASPIDPDFTYNLGGELIQVDYAGGEQKTFTYNGSGQLTQVDSTRLTTTKRKIFTYTGGGELDYITEQWL